jgi:hypothetical protein
MVLMLISLTQDCYKAIRKIRDEMKEQKRQNGEPEKTTFSEIVFMFIQKYQRPMTTQKDVGELNLDSPLASSDNNELIPNDHE